MSKEELITSDVTRTTLAVLFIGVLIASSFWVLHPFLTSIVWATIVAIATWPFLGRGGSALQPASRTL